MLRRFGVGLSVQMCFTWSPQAEIRTGIYIKRCANDCQPTHFAWPEDLTCLYSVI